MKSHSRDSLTITDWILIALTIGGLALFFAGFILFAHRARIAKPLQSAMILAAVVSVWLAVTAVLAQAGLLAEPNAAPPRLPLVAIAPVPA